jgi:Cft2 family RNA processing exonuclease
MVRWAVHEVIPNGKVPTFKTDSLGNAQEIIYIFNRMTKLPVVTAQSATKASGVYRDFGHQLEYIDSNSDEGKELLEEGRCVFIIPKGMKPLQNNFEVAFASGWAAIIKGRQGRSFPLSDHADFRGLLSFIRRCHPKRVLTIHGGTITRGFNSYVRKRLGIDTRPLTTRQETLMGPVSRVEIRARACQEQLLGTIRIPGFEYASPWLVREMARRGFNRRETETALQRLLENGLLVPSKSGVKLR